MLNTHKLCSYSQINVYICQLSLYPFVVSVSILEKIIAVKKLEVAELESQFSIEHFKAKAKALKVVSKSFYDSLFNSKKPAIIAEVKRASPSKGMIREDLNPVQTAKDFAEAGAACLSILTDTSFFKGEKKYILEIKNSLKNDCPAILRKDFIIDELQIWESLALGADAILLIVAALNTKKLAALITESHKAGLDILIEIHNEKELNTLSESIKLIKELPKIIIGINNRNLNTFETNLEVTKELAIQVKNKIKVTRSLLITESGIFTSEDLQKLDSYGAQGFLIGESLVAEGNPGQNLKTLIEGFHLA